MPRLRSLSDFIAFDIPYLLLQNKTFTPVLLIKKLILIALVSPPTRDLDDKLPAKSFTLSASGISPRGRERLLHIHTL